MNPKLAGAIAALIIAVLLVFVIMWLVHRAQRQENIREGRHMRGDLTKAQERMIQQENAEAFAILRRIRKPASSLDGEIILIPDDLGESIDKLIERHEKTMRALPANAHLDV